MKQLKGHRARVIYSRLFKYTQQLYREQQLGPHLLSTALHVRKYVWPHHFTCTTHHFTCTTHHFTCTTDYLPVPIHESDRSCICVLWVLILTLSLRFCFYMILDLVRHCGIVCFFHFILINSNVKSLDDLFQNLWRHVLNVAQFLTQWKLIENRTVNVH